MPECVESPEAALALLCLDLSQRRASCTRATVFRVVRNMLDRHILLFCCYSRLCIMQTTCCWDTERDCKQTLKRNYFCDTYINKAERNTAWSANQHFRKAIIRSRLAYVMFSHKAGPHAEEHPLTIPHKEIQVEAIAACSVQTPVCHLFDLWFMPYTEQRWCVIRPVVQKQTTAMVRHLQSFTHQASCGADHLLYKHVQYKHCYDKELKLIDRLNN